MAQKNLEPQLSSGMGAYRRGDPQPPPPMPTPKSVESTEGLEVLVDANKYAGKSTSSLATLPFFHEISFSGFEPNDTGGSSLFRLWRGHFTAIRSDREEFTVEVTFKQSDTPYVTGPMVQEALETLMEYRGCGCRPSGKVMCGKHGDGPEDAA